MHFETPSGLSLMPYFHGVHWLTALQALSQCSLAAACHLAIVTCSKHNAHVQEHTVPLSHGIPVRVVRDLIKKGSALLATDRGKQCCHWDYPFCKGPIQMALLCHTVNVLNSSDLGSRPSRNNQRKRQTQLAASVWPDLQHVKLQCQHEVSESLHFKKRSAHKVKQQASSSGRFCT